MAQPLKINTTARAETIRPILYRRGGLEWRRLTVRFRHQGKPRAKRPSPLHPYDEIEEFHAPANGKAVANVAAKNGIHRRRNLEQLGRCKKDFDEFLAGVPRF